MKHKENTENESDKGLVTCVRLSKETRDKLAELGTKDQTFDQIVQNLLDNKNRLSKQEDDIDGE